MPGTFRIGKIAGIDIDIHVSWIIILVLYDPNPPAEAKIHSFEGLWLTSGLVMIIGAGLSLIFTGLFVSVLR
jgi:hypothetical protein